MNALDNFWKGLSDEEKKIGINAIADFQEKKMRKEKIDALKKEIFDNIRTLYNLTNCDEWDEFTEELTNDVPIT